MLSAYHLFVFTDFVPVDATTDSGANIQDMFGWSMVGCIVGNLLTNIGIILKEVISQFIIGWKEKRTKDLRLKQEKLKKEQKEIEQKI